ncbi:MAG: RtcB family protein [Gammaproteobacteria bacterium]|nr:RtcB family protein [Gammaproteobacteria bacterium]MYI78195.1 RtcB family protein [Gammaproteobacteria bacterium]
MITNEKVQIFNRDFRGNEIVPIEAGAIEQVRLTSELPIVQNIALMPDAHVGIGATVGSVIGTTDAIIPAAVGVDIGCGMTAAETNLSASDLPDSLAPLRGSIERNVPHGRTSGGKRSRDIGGWSKEIPEEVYSHWHSQLEKGFNRLLDRHPDLKRANHISHLGTLGTGNHFIEVCLDEEDTVWVMLHSGSRGIGNRIGMKFIELAKQDMRRHEINLPDRNLAYLQEGNKHFSDYIMAVDWAQRFAFLNRKIMMNRTVSAIRQHLSQVEIVSEVIECHHNYVANERHHGKNMWVTRKGALRARRGDVGIIPGSMGAKSYIVRGKGSKHSLQSCSHGAGRALSRTEAKKRYSAADLRAQTIGVECRKDHNVVDELPAAYKDIDKVMEAQQDLVEIVHTLKQIVCVKG